MESDYNINISKLNKNEAEDFMKSFELMGNIGLGVWHYGLLYNGELISVVSYGTTCFGNIKGFLKKINESFEFKAIQICRGATKQKILQYAASRLISNANRLLSEEMGNLIIVGYSDPEWKENGDVYQSCNAIYTGMTNPKDQSNYVINGEFLTGWQVFKRYGTRNFLSLKSVDPSAQKIPLEPKHRYIFVCGNKYFKNSVSKLLDEFRVDYPKRNGYLPNIF